VVSVLSPVLSPISAPIATAVPIVVDVDDLRLFFFAGRKGVAGGPFAEDGPLEQDRAAGQRRVARLGVEDDLGEPPGFAGELSVHFRFPAPRILRRKQVAKRQEDLARQLAVPTRGAQMLQRRRDRLRDQLSDVAHAVAVGIERVAQRRQQQRGQDEGVRRRDRTGRRRAIERRQVAPEARPSQRRLVVGGFTFEAAGQLGDQELEQVHLDQQLQ
jgi:hypothetical protein